MNLLAKRTFSNYSRWDRLWSAAIRSLGKLRFYDDGYGSPQQLRTCEENMKYLQNRELCTNLQKLKYEIKLTTKKILKDENIVLINGEFNSPISYVYPDDLVPDELKTCYFQLVFPHRPQTEISKIVIHTAGTGDHGFKRRCDLLAKPLLSQHNIASCILENPFYGRRKPKHQLYSGLRRFPDLVVLGGGVAFEANVIRNWLIEKTGVTSVGVTGISLGGHTAALAAAGANTPVPCCAAYAWCTSTGVWTRGSLSTRINWKKLALDYYSNPEYKKIENEFGSGLERWFEKLRVENGHEVDRSKIPELVEMRFEENCDENRAKNFFALLSDHFSHFGNYLSPIEPDLTTFISGDNDYFYSRQKTSDMTTVWPGVKVLKLDYGHVDGFLFGRSIYINEIASIFEKYAEKYDCPDGNFEIFENVTICDDSSGDKGTDFIQKTFGKVVTAVSRSIG